MDQSMGFFYPSTGVAWGILSGLATRCWLHLVTNGRLAGPNRGNETMKIHMLSFTVSFVAVAMVSRDSYWIEDVVECLGKRGDTSN